MEFSWITTVCCVFSCEGTITAIFCYVTHIISRPLIKVTKDVESIEINGLLSLRKASRQEAVSALHHIWHQTSPHYKNSGIVWHLFCNTNTQP